MRRKVVVVVAACVLAIAGVVGLTIWLTWPAPEPSYNGHTLSYWLGTYPVASESKMPAASVPQALQAREAISSIGTNALPLLLSRLRHEADPLRRAAYSLLVRVPSRFRPKWLAECELSHFFEPFSRVLNHTPVTEVTTPAEDV
jgi:hypothetical protein